MFDARTDDPDETSDKSPSYLLGPSDFDDVKESSLRMSEFLLSKGISLTSTNADGDAVPAQSIRAGVMSAAWMLLGTKGIDIEARNLDGRSPLLLAADHGRPLMIPLVVTMGGRDISAKNLCGFNAVQLAEFSGHLKTETVLASYGCPVPTDFYGSEALFGAEKGDMDDSLQR